MYGFQPYKQKLYRLSRCVKRSEKGQKRANNRYEGKEEKFFGNDQALDRKRYIQEYKEFSLEGQREIQEF